MVNEEERWVDAAQRGDREAFRHLVEAHARPLFTLCARITRDAALAEDAVQEALFNAYRHLADFDKRSAFKTWLHRIAVNAALEQLRRRHDKEIVSTDLGNSEEDFLSSHAVESPGPAQHARRRDPPSRRCRTGTHERSRTHRLRDASCGRSIT